jgi:hypothetical protein
MGTRTLNRRRALAVAAGVLAAQVAPYDLVAQDAPAEVTLVEPGDDDAVWVAGGEAAVAGVFTVYANGTVSARNVAEAYRAILDQKTPLRAFQALLEAVEEG